MFASSLSTPGLSVLALANLPIYHTQPLKTRPILEAYSILILYILGSRPIPKVYIQSLSIRFLSATHILPGIGSILTAYIQLLGKKSLITVFKQLFGTISGAYM